MLVQLLESSRTVSVKGVRLIGESYGSFMLAFPATDYSTVKGFDTQTGQLP